MEVFLRSSLEMDAEWIDFLESLSGQAALAIDNASLFESLQRSNLELGMAYETTLEGWSAALDLRDKETEGHTRRVTDLTLELAETMGLSERERVHIRRGALLHDIGKIGVPGHLLRKEGPLSEDEWALMRRHPEIGERICRPLTASRSFAPIIRHHHERFDGTGYPDRLRADGIPLGARIVAIADAYEAIAHGRPYQPARPHSAAVDELSLLRGRQFDPDLVPIFVDELERDLAGIAPAISLPTVARLEPEPALGA
jgi:putative nucleotidyltransferase with HDIG domain